MESGVRKKLIILSLIVLVALALFSFLYFGGIGSFSRVECRDNGDCVSGEACDIITGLCTSPENVNPYDELID